MSSAQKPALQPILEFTGRVSSPVERELAYDVRSQDDWTP